MCAIKVREVTRIDKHVMEVFWVETKSTDGPEVYSSGILSEIEKVE